MLRPRRLSLVPVVFWVLFRLTFAAALPAQKPPAKKKSPGNAAAKTSGPADRFPLAALHITGNKIFPAGAIIGVTGLKPGDRINETDLKAALQRLQDTGAFESLSYRYGPEGDQIAATFEVQEVVDLYPVQFDRLGVPDADLVEVLRQKVPLFGPQVPATGAMVKQIVDAIQSFLAGRGKSMEVTGKVLPAPGGKLAMIFLPAAAPPAIAYVKFEGSAVLRPEALQKAFFQAAVGVPYTERRLSELLDANIRPLFEARGRLQARFGPFRAEESKEATGVVVTVPVEDGPAYSFGDISFGGEAGSEDKELRRLLKFHSNDPANFDLVNQSLSDITRRFEQDGYLNARAAADRALNERMKTVALVIRVEKGDRYLFRGLEIKGLDINAEAAVRRRWGMEKGAPFSSSYPAMFLKRIEDDGMFDRLAGTSSHVTIDEEAKMVDVELVFKGGQPPESRRDAGGQSADPGSRRR